LTPLARKREIAEQFRKTTIVRARYGENMWSNSQLFVVIGLFFEFASVFMSVRKLFWGYSKRSEGKMPINREIRKDRLEGTVVLCLLTIGMILQAIAVFV
jgi:hypothetical protein